MVSDRDLAVRVLTDDNIGRDTALSQIMTAGVHHVHADDDVASAIETMARHQVHRVPVVDRSTERTVGIVSLGDLGRKAPEAGREALEGISQMDPR
jgi:CBS domain-containing protein